MRDQKHLGIFRSLLRADPRSAGLLGVGWRPHLPADPFTSQRSTSASLTLMFTRRISIYAAIRD